MSSEWDDERDDDAENLDVWDESSLTTDDDESSAEAYSPAKTAPKLVGHQAIVQHLEALHAAEKLPHAMLFSGTKGIGKAKLAESLARMLLAGKPTMEVSDFHPVVAQMQAGSCGDYLYISGENKASGDEKEKAVLIDIEQIRAIDHFLGLTRSSCPMRVVIIDGAETMNANAANALLKNLEEPPPHTMIILISHNAAKLLPTIRSRCRLIQFTPLTHAECLQVLTSLTGSAPTESLSLLVALADSSPGLALNWHNLGGAAMYQQLCELFSADMDDVAQINAVMQFADEVCGNKSIIHQHFQMLMGLLLAFFSRMHHTEPQGINDVEARAMQKWLERTGVDGAVACWFEVKEQFQMAQGLHLDYKNLLTTLLLRLIRGKMPLSLKSA
jgi:DNA polymerase-3 subunit delta'